MNMAGANVKPPSDTADVADGTGTYPKTLVGPAF